MLPVWRLSFLYATLFFELGINLPFFPVWLRSQSLGDAAIGFIVAVPFYMRIIANPAVSAVADRFGRLEETLVACAIVVAIASVGLVMVDSFVGIILVVAAIALAQGPLIALTDALTLANLARVTERIGRYGRIRLWGSVAFALANISAGTLLVFLPAQAIVFFLIGSSAVVAVAAVTVARGLIGVGGRTTTAPVRQGPRPKGGATRAPMRQILLVVLGAACVQASHGTYYSFSTLHWQSVGLSSATVGLLWAVGIVSEISFFAFLHRFTALGIKLGAIVLIGAAAAVVRWLAMSTDPVGAVLIPLQMTHALSFGATHAGSIFLLSRLAPEGMRAQVQGWVAAAWAGLMAVLISLSGTLMPTFGERTYLLMATVAAVGFGLLAAALVPRR